MAAWLGKEAGGVGMRFILAGALLLVVALMIGTVLGLLVAVRVGVHRSPPMVEGRQALSEGCKRQATTANLLWDSGARFTSSG
jgi:hypothetical protein